MTDDAARRRKEKAQREKAQRRAIRAAAKKTRLTGEQKKRKGK